MSFKFMYIYKFNIDRYITCDPSISGSFLPLINALVDMCNYQKNQNILVSALLNNSFQISLKVTVCPQKRY